MEEWLRKASINQLRDFLRGRFQGIGPHAADTGTPVAELPHDLPLALWKEADAELRGYIIHALKDLIEEIPCDGWSCRAIEWLNFFIARANIRDIGVIDTLAGVARRQHWLKGTEDGPRCLASLLRTLLDLGWEPEPDYWLHLPKEVQSRFPGLVFRGLLARDLDRAFDYLPGAVRSREHAHQVIGVLADVMEQPVLRTRVIQRLSCALPALPAGVSAYFAKRFRTYGWGDLAHPEPQPRPLPFRPSHSCAFDGHVGQQLSFALAAP